MHESPTPLKRAALLLATCPPVEHNKRGGQRKSSDLAIETALILRAVFRLPLRQTEGFLNSTFT